MKKFIFMKSYSPRTLSIFTALTITLLVALSFLFLIFAKKIQSVVAIIFILIILFFVIFFSLHVSTREKANQAEVEGGLSFGFFLKSFLIQLIILFLSFFS